MEHKVIDDHVQKPHLLAIFPIPRLIIPMILPNKPNQRIIHLPRMRRTQKMLSVLHSHQLRIRRVDKHLNLLFRIRNRIDNITRPLITTISKKGTSKNPKRKTMTTSPSTHMQPHNGTSNIEQASMQTISLPQVNRRHARSPPAIVALIIALDGFGPEISNAAVTVLAEANVYQKVAEFVVWFEIGGGLGAGPSVDGTGAGVYTVPAAERAGSLGFKVEGCAKWNDTLDLRRRKCQCVFTSPQPRCYYVANHTLSGASKAILTVIHPP